MWKTTTAVMILAGLFLFVGSCVPMGTIIYLGALKAPDASVDLSAAGSSATIELHGSPGKLARLAIEADINTPSVQEAPGRYGGKYRARFRFPVSYDIREQSGSSLLSEDLLLAWKGSGSIIKSDEQVSSTGGSLRVLSHFDKFSIPDDGRMQVEIEISPDQTYQASMSSATLHFYEGMVDNTRYVAASVIMLVSGFILVMLGFIFTLTSAMSAPAVALHSSQATAAVVEPGLDSSVRQQAMFIQLSALAGFFIPFGNIILPVVLWMSWRTRDPYLDDMGREAVNFQLSMLVYYLVCIVLMLVLIGFVLIVLAVVFHMAYTIIASAQTSRGLAFHYPLAIRFIRP